MNLGDPSPPDHEPRISPFSSNPPTRSPSGANLRRNFSAIFFQQATAVASEGGGESSTGQDDHPCLGANERTRLLAPRSSVGHWGDSSVEGSHGAVSGLSSVGEPNDLPGPSDERARRKQHKVNKAVAKIRQRSRYYVPVTDWLPQYNWSLFSGDLVAGISVACLLIPQAMSYANGLAHLTPVAGLWSTAIPALIYAILGTCRQLSVGPEAALSLLIGQMTHDIIYGDPHKVPDNPDLEAISIAIVCTFQVGLITSVLGLLRLGFLDVVLSRALLRGFITAVGIIIFIDQLIPMLGMAAILSHPEAENAPTLPLSKLIFTISHLSHANKAATIISFSSLTFLILARIVKQKIAARPMGQWVRFVPEIFLVVVGATLLNSIMRWDLAGVEVLGKISGTKSLPFGLPLVPRTMKHFKYTFPTAFVMAIVGVVDSIVAARENASKFGYPVSPNRELVALGASNLTASLLTVTGAVPVFGSLTRSRLNAQTGGRSQMSSVITATLMILSIFFLLPYFYFLPKAVLAAIITLVVYAILAEAPHEIAFFWKMRAWTDFLQMTGTFFLTLLFSIEVGLVASVVFSLILVIQKSTQPRIKIIGRLPDTDEWVPIDEDEHAQEEIPGVLVIRIRESLSFANTGQLKERLRRLELYGMSKAHPSDAPRRDSAKAIILHIGDVEEIDASATQILYELTKSYTANEVAIHFTHLRPSHHKIFELVGITDIVGHDNFHPDLRSAMQKVESLGYGNTTLSRD